MQTKYFPASPNNYEKGRGTEKIELIILHWSAAQTLAMTDAKFVDGNRLASVNYAVDGTEIHQYVKDENTAYHAGSATVDKKSISIVVIGGVNMPISQQTYQTVTLLIEELCRKYRLKVDADHIKGHNALTKTQCPGTLDIPRIITDAKKLSPQTIIERTRLEKDAIEQQLKEVQKRNDTAEARFDELRKIIQEKDQKIIMMSQDMVYMVLRGTELEEKVESALAYRGKAEAEIAASKSQSIFAIIWGRVKRWGSSYNKEQ